MPHTPQIRIYINFIHWYICVRIKWDSLRKRAVCNTVRGQWMEDDDLLTKSYFPQHTNTTYFGY